MPRAAFILATLDTGAALRDVTRAAHQVDPRRRQIRRPEAS
jgi:hypothetical protein